MPELTVAAGLAKALVDFAAAHGACPSDIVARADLSLDSLRDQDERIPLESYVRLMRAAKDVTSDPALPLKFGMSVHMAEFSVVGLIFHACANIAEAIRQVNRYGQLIIETGVGSRPRFEFEKRDGHVWLVDHRPQPNEFPELTEATFARFIGMTRPIWETPLVDEMHVTHSAPDHADEYCRVCGVTVGFDRDWNAMRVDAERLKQPIATQPRYAFGILSKHAEQLLVELEDSKTTRGKVEHLLMPILHTGDVGMHAIAKKLGVSRQTLFRRLKSEGVTYERVLDELRHKLALHYIAGEKASVHETAYLVGFSDRAAFSRAFKRWTGVNPSRARHPQEG